MGRSLKELRRAVAPLAPQVAAPRPVILPTDRPLPIQERVEQRKAELRTGYPVKR